MRKLLIGIVAIAGLLVLGTKLYLWHKTTTIADSFIALAAPFASISYDGTTSSLWSGRTGLTGLAIRPNGMDSVIHIEELTLEAGDLPSLLSISSMLGERNAPEALRLNITRAQLDVDSALFRDTLSAPDVWSLFGLPYGTLACGDRGRFSATDFNRMGIRAVEFDLHVGYQLDPAAGSISFQVNGRDYDLDAITLELTAQIPTGSGLSQLTQAKPRLSRGHLHFSDLGWNARWRKFCAAENQQTEAEFLAAHVATVRNALVLQGIGISDAMAESYQAFLADNAVLDITLRPAQPVDMDHLKFYAPDSLVYYLNPVVTVNEKPLPIEVKSLDATAVAKARSSQAKITETATDYEPIALKQLSRHLGEHVRLTLKNGRVFEGKLVKMDARVARLERPNFSGGVYEVLVLLWEVQKAAVTKN